MREEGFMMTEISIGQLLRWRLSQAEAEAPPAPRAERLLELARPWWEALPGKARAVLDRLGTIQLAYGHAMANPRNSRMGHPVPALIVGAEGDQEASARVLYLTIRDDRLRLRFELDPTLGEPERTLEATFVSGDPMRPLFTAQATPSVDGEYRIDADLPEEVARSWAQLKVTDPMPFRLILRAGSAGG